VWEMECPLQPPPTLATCTSLSAQRWGDMHRSSRDDGKRVFYVPGRQRKSLMHKVDEIPGKDT
jgi:hypothetical protein